MDILHPNGILLPRRISLPLDLPDIIELVWRLKSVLNFDRSRPSRYPYVPDQASITVTSKLLERKEMGTIHVFLVQSLVLQWFLTSTSTTSYCWISLLWLPRLTAKDRNCVQYNSNSESYSTKQIRQKVSNLSPTVPFQNGEHCTSIMTKIQCNKPLIRANLILSDPDGETFFRFECGNESVISVVRAF